MPLRYNFYKKKTKPNKVYEMNKPYMHYLQIANTNQSMKLKMFTSNSCRYCNIVIIRPYSYKVAYDFEAISNYL